MSIIFDFTKVEFPAIAGELSATINSDTDSEFSIEVFDDGGGVFWVRPFVYDHGETVMVCLDGCNATDAKRDEITSTAFDISGAEQLLNLLQHRPKGLFQCYDCIVNHRPEGVIILHEAEGNDPTAIPAAALPTVVEALKKAIAKAKAISLKEYGYEYKTCEDLVDEDDYIF